MNTIRQQFRTIPWLRITAESVAVIASILIAFAIDAWWDQRQTAEIKSELIDSLKGDFRENLTEIQRAIEVANSDIKQMDRFRSLYQESDFSSIDDLGNSLRPAFHDDWPDLVVSTLDSAISNGAISLIANVDVNKAISDFNRARSGLESHNATHHYMMYSGAIMDLRNEIGDIRALYASVIDQTSLFNGPGLLTLSDKELVEIYSKREVYALVSACRVLKANKNSIYRNLDIASRDLIEALENL